MCGESRFGNKMFMLVPAITAAYEHNATLVLIQNELTAKKESDCSWSDKLRDVFQYFNSSAPLIRAEVLQKWWYLPEYEFFKYESNYYKAKVNYTVGGYRQSWRYMQTSKQQKAVRQVFKFTPRYEKYARETIAKAKDILNAKQVITVGVHMRIGDLTEKWTLDYGYVMAQQDFYKDAIDMAIQTFNNNDIILIVASDSIVKAKEMLSTNNITSNHKTHFLHGSAFEDFATLSKCDHIITSGGTYGWWAAWLAGGKTFYHANFSKPGSDFDMLFSNEKFYMPNWIPIYTVSQKKPSTSRPDVIMTTSQNCSTR